MLKDGLNSGVVWSKGQCDTKTCYCIILTYSFNKRNIQTGVVIILSCYLIRPIYLDYFLMQPLTLHVFPNAATHSTHVKCSMCQRPSNIIMS